MESVPQSRPLSASDIKEGDLVTIWGPVLPVPDVVKDENHADLEGVEVEFTPPDWIEKYQGLVFKVYAVHNPFVLCAFMAGNGKPAATAVFHLHRVHLAAVSEDYYQAFCKLKRDIEEAEAPAPQPVPAEGEQQEMFVIQVPIFNDAFKRELPSSGTPTPPESEAA